MIFDLVGSLGLFLLGMWLMTEGLKLAGGHALKNLLGQWTSTRLRGLVSGILITALVQSSSAVTVATIGFVNAGLLAFRQALWVVFGSNVGTTFTAWLITLLGFSLKIDALAFPLVGIGAALRVISPYQRGRALGMALAGFGLLFMGIAALTENFSGYAQQINIEVLLTENSHTTLLGLLIGLLLTVLTQSSSAAIAIILTAVASGVAGLDVAAAAVIGANIGTTSTAIIAVIGATPNAKRLAWAHVTFNLITALVALLLLPVFWSLTSVIASMVNVDGNALMSLAIFHTCFNTLGVILMWPLEPRLSVFLLGMYKRGSKQGGELSGLDANVSTIPDVAIKAMTLELQTLAIELGQVALPTSTMQNVNEAQLNSIAERLDAVNQFIALTLKSELTKEQGAQLTAGLSVSHYLQNAYKTYTSAVAIHLLIKQPSSLALQQMSYWLTTVNEFNRGLVHSDTALQRERLTDIIDHYRIVKTQLLAAAVEERIDVETVDAALQVASLSRRFIEQMVQANDALQALASVDAGKSSTSSSLAADRSGVAPQEAAKREKMVG